MMRKDLGAQYYCVVVGVAILIVVGVLFLPQTKWSIDNSGTYEVRQGGPVNESQEEAPGNRTKYTYDKREVTPRNDTTLDDFVKELVVVTAISANHFIELQDLLISVRKCLPENRIILYDLGLKQDNINTLKAKYSDIEIRPFRFSKYKSSHIKNLKTYAWKPIIIKEVSMEHRVIMYGDASMRMVSCNIKRALSLLRHFPLIAAIPPRFKAIEFVHDRMIKYLKYPKERKDLANMSSIEATAFLILANHTMKQKFIFPWYDCALHEECIAPQGPKHLPCHFTRDHDGHFIGCHRFDQAAMDMILAREFGPVDPIKAQNGQVSRSIWNILKTEAVERRRKEREKRKRKT